MTDLKYVNICGYCKIKSPKYSSVVHIIKVNGYAVKRSNSAILILPPFFNGDLFLKKRICSHRSKFFSLRTDPIWEWFLKKWRKNEVYLYKNFYKLTCTNVQVSFCNTPGVYIGGDICVDKMLKFYFKVFM